MREAGAAGGEIVGYDSRQLVLFPRLLKAMHCDELIVLFSALNVVGALVRRLFVAISHIYYHIEKLR